ncbi:hypothetical protein CBOM_07681 [Ceraceosorus bombacis]|uniref:Uncharacterized protein n=1 Tax=Ceraceosorus bombacis TaxID=401625 RepID=A0A0P1BMX3_9BASI|nr:hypothetical protein CBOM_07681 [Ceraceosorus bombacis]
MPSPRISRANIIWSACGACVWRAERQRRCTSFGCTRYDWRSACHASLHSNSIFTSDPASFSRALPGTAHPSLGYGRRLCVSLSGSSLHA